jgi:hypothetical protein
VSDFGAVAALWLSHEERRFAVRHYRIDIRQSQPDGETPEWAVQTVGTCRIWLEGPHRRG